MKFGEDANSYVGHQPDVKPLKQALSICSWVKKLREGSDEAVWLSYSTPNSHDEIAISDSGISNILMGHNIDTTSLMTVPPGKWHHYCLTWSLQSNFQRVYIQGELIHELSRTVQRELFEDPVNGRNYFVLGNDVGLILPFLTVRKYRFSGELTQLNVFSKELSAMEVAEIWRSGFSLSYAWKHKKSRYLKWEEILLWRRFGSVEDVEISLGKLSILIC